MIYLSSFGQVPMRILFAVASKVAKLSGLEVRISQNLIPPKVGLDPIEGVYNPYVLLEYLASLEFPHMKALLVISAVPFSESRRTFFRKDPPRAIILFLTGRSEEETFELNVREAVNCLKILGIK